MQIGSTKKDLKSRLTLDVESVYSPNPKSRPDINTASPSKDKRLGFFEDNSAGDSPVKIQKSNVFES